NPLLCSRFCFECYGPPVIDAVIINSRFLIKHAYVLVAARFSDYLHWSGPLVDHCPALVYVYLIGVVEQILEGLSPFPVAGVIHELSPKDFAAFIFSSMCIHSSE